MKVCWHCALQGQINIATALVLGTSARGLARRADAESFVQRLARTSEREPPVVVMVSGQDDTTHSAHRLAWSSKVRRCRTFWA